ncbi:N-acetylneuraminate synthase family protein [Acinetobacter faecalis]|uniref:N-acetylneuraminate synthase family protein n=1 Tax=Acinetobacter faecalis TaxID=2665161 RepID=UPI002A9207B9|nr:N-acetylneuraminate synthase family protein [Acinetobacter faecalis]MDY6531274.1 N-acetylneuraminate synthase family protein [Acinetobacter faecalis]
MKLIAETAWHHDGDFVFYSNLIDHILRSSVDVIKLHILVDLDKYMDIHHSAYEFLKERMFSKAQWIEILEKISISGKELMVLVNDTDAVDLVAAYNPLLVEVHSVALNNPHLLNKIDKTFDSRAKIVLGVGGSSLYEIENAASQFSNKQIVLMFGFQNYPTRYEDVNFNKIRRVMQAFPEYEFGYADHTAWDLKENVLITLMGAAVGMDYIEKHVTIKYGEQRTDWSAAVSFEMLEEIKKGMNILEQCNGDGLLALNTSEQQYCKPGIMKQIGIANCDIPEGEIFDMNSVSFLRSGLLNGMQQLDLWAMQGKVLTKSLTKGDVISSTHFGC